MLFSVETLKEIFPNYEGKITFPYVENILLDSREISKRSLFVPIIGEKFNAHDYIEQAIENGAIASLWDRKIDVPSHLKNNCCFFYVDDTVLALQKLARYYREEINPIVIGITGSNGKTTTKDLVASLLNTSYKTHKTAGNFNNHIGLPITILTMPRDTEVLVLEMGMNNFGEIDVLSRIATPDYAIITNIGESHIQFLGSREGIAKSKLEITNSLKETGTLIIDGDETLLRDIHGSFSIIRCGFTEHEENMYQIDDVKVNIDSTTFNISKQQYSIPLLGAHHAKNATYALVLAKKLGISNEKIVQGFNNVKQSEMRFEKIKSDEGATIINDAYNASPTSMVAAIDVIKNMSGFNRKILVLGDIFELGERAEVFHKQIAKSIDSTIHVVFTLGNHAKLITEIVSAKYNHIISENFTSKEKLVEALRPYVTKETVILFKASRGMKFEKIIEQLISQHS